MLNGDQPFEWRGLLNQEIRIKVNLYEIVNREEQNKCSCKSEGKR